MTVPVVEGSTHRSDRHLGSGMKRFDPEVLGVHLGRLFQAASALCGWREVADDLVQETVVRVLPRAGSAQQGTRIRTLHRDIDLMLLRGRRPSQGAGVVTTVVLVGVCTGLIYPLERVTTVSSLGVVYLLGVVVVSAYWGVWFGVTMSVLSAAAFDFFHLPPILRFAIADSRDWVALGAFLVVAVATSTVSELARARAVEADQRRAEADLTAEMAQMVLARAGLRDALVPIGRALAAAFGLAWASVTLDQREGMSGMQRFRCRWVSGGWARWWSRPACAQGGRHVCGSESRRRWPPCWRSVWSVSNW